MRDVALAAYREAEAKLKDTYMRAPFDGEIGARYVKNHTDVLLKVPVLSLVNVSLLEVVVDVPEGQIATLNEDEIGRISATLAAAPDKEFELRLKDIASQANPKTRTYRVKLLMLQPEDLNVLPGMTVSVTVYPKEDLAPSRLVIPAKAALADSTGEMHVWIIDDEMRANRRKVSVGSLTGTDGIEVLSGLEGGERIAVTGMTKLQEDMEVRLLNE